MRSSAKEYQDSNALNSARNLQTILTAFVEKKGKTCLGFSSSVSEMRQPLSDLTKMDAVGLCRLAVMEGLPTT